MDCVSNRRKSKTQGLVYMQRNDLPEMRALHRTPENSAHVIKSHMSTEKTQVSMFYVDPMQSVLMQVRPTRVWHGLQTMLADQSFQTMLNLHQVLRRVRHCFDQPGSSQPVVRFSSTMVESIGRDRSGVGPCRILRQLDTQCATVQIDAHREPRCHNFWFRPTLVTDPCSHIFHALFTKRHAQEVCDDLEWWISQIGHC